MRVKRWSIFLAPNGWLAPRSAFTLVEVTIVSGFLGIFALLLSQTWTGLGRPLVDISARCRVAQEADAAVTSLERDLCGSLADNQGRLGSKTAYQFVGRLQPGNRQLWLCFDSGTNPNGIADWAPPDTVIIYQLVGNNLQRVEQGTGAAYTVARYVQQMQVIDLGSAVQIVLTFTFRNVTQTYNLIAEDP
jgi:hypothetical protein